jgi:hypothetical protein
VVGLSNSSKDSDLAHRRPNCVEITCADRSLFRAWTSGDVAAAVDVLQEAHCRWQAGIMSKTKKEEVEKMYGVNWNADGLLADKELRKHLDVVQCFTYDWVHTLLQDGAFTIEVFHMLKACKIENSIVEAFLKDPLWKFPAASSSKSGRLHTVFNSYRSSSSHEADKLKCSASEALGLYGLLRHFIEVYAVIGDDLVGHRASWEAACKTVGLLLAAKHEAGSCAAIGPHVSSSTAAHMKSHIAAYGTDLVRPKHHWQMHLGDQLLRDGIMLDAFVIERMHLVTKRVADPVKNLGRFERSVVSGVLTEHSRCLAEVQSSPCLVGACKSLPDDPDVFIANRLVWSGCKVVIIIVHIMWVG